MLGLKEVSSTFLSLVDASWLAINDAISNATSSQLWQEYHAYVITPFLLALVVILWYTLRWRKGPEQASLMNLVAPPERIPLLSDRSGRKFRKRDRLNIQAHKLMRKVRGGVENLRHPDLISNKLTRKIGRFLSRSDRRNSDYKDRTLPSAYYGDEGPGLPGKMHQLMGSTRLFGYLDNDVLIRLLKKSDQRILRKDEMLFEKGSPDDHMYLVQSGKLALYVDDPAEPQLLCHFREGQSIHSLFSFIDVLSNKPSIFKTLYCQAVEPSEVFAVPIVLFQSTLADDPHQLNRIIQFMLSRVGRIGCYVMYDILNLSAGVFQSYSVRRSRSHSTSFSRAKGTATGSSNVMTSDEQVSSSTSTNIQDGSSSDTASNPKKSSQSVAETSFTGETTEPNGAATWNPSRRNSRNYSTINETNAVRDLADLFGLENHELLNGSGCRFHEAAKNDVIFSQGDVSPLVLVLSGEMVARRQQAEPLLESTLFSQDRLNEMIHPDLGHVRPGQICGLMAVLGNEVSYFSAIAVANQTTSYMSISRQALRKIFTKEPQVIRRLSRIVSESMSPFMRQIDFPTEWTRIEAGRVLYKPNDESDSIYVCLNGRMRSVVKVGQKPVARGEFGRGQMFGLMELITKTPRLSTMMAVRDSELVRIPSELLDHMKLANPAMVTRLIQLLGQRLDVHQPNAPELAPPELSGERGDNLPHLNTIALLPVSLPSNFLLTFAIELVRALRPICSARILSSDDLRKEFNVPVLDRLTEDDVMNFLYEVEEAYNIVLYVCDTGVTWWTRRCLRQADMVLAVADFGEHEKPATAFEIEVNNSYASRIRQELVLLHRYHGDSASSALRPRQTVNWLNDRVWVQRHHHIRLPDRLFSRTRTNRSQLLKRLERGPPKRSDDISRLARHLTGTTVGLVLGGGGARGASHIGILQCLFDKEIPIDYVAGVSIGAFMGALWAMDTNLDVMFSKSKAWFKKVTSTWTALWDITYPYTSLMTGRAFNQLLIDVFKRTQIEDLWIPYFTITTDITESKMRIHEHGSLWHYVRASMSLASFLPPLCDPIDGHLLLDGGYVNNLPADVMRARGCKTIFAVDVGAVDDQNLHNYGSSLSGWWVLWKRWMPFGEAVRIPGMSEIQSRLAYVACQQRLDSVKASSYCHYIRPHVEMYPTLSFGLFDAIYERGLDCGREFLSTFLESQTYATMYDAADHPWLQNTRANTSSRKEPKTLAFPELAQLVSHIPPQPSHLPLGRTPSSGEEEPPDGYTSEHDRLNEHDDELLGNQSDTAAMDWPVYQQRRRRNLRFGVDIQSDPEVPNDSD